MELIPFSVHILIHFILALAVGWLIGRYFQRVWLGVVFGILGGFLIDFDHLLEYFLFFGPHFNFRDFLDSRQFLLSSQIHLWFHAWEYTLVLLAAAVLFRKCRLPKIALLTLALATTVHLVSDTIINEYPPEHYSLIYRVKVNFAAEKLLSPTELVEYLVERKRLGL